jgi:hypothetical protein
MVTPVEVVDNTNDRDFRTVALALGQLDRSAACGSRSRSTVVVGLDTGIDVSCVADVVAMRLADSGSLTRRSRGDHVPRSFRAGWHAMSERSESSGGGGNCTRVFNYVTICPKCGYDTALSGWLEMGREDEALRELVANWHCLTPSVRAAIIELIR